jgi:hypothetical protein
MSSKEKMRDDFEKKYPIPDGIFWDHELDYYTTKNEDLIYNMDCQNERYEIWMDALTHHHAESEPSACFIMSESGYLMAVCYDCEVMARLMKDPGQLKIQWLYASPQPAAQVPSEVDAGTLYEGSSKDTPYIHTLRWAQGWNACREKMLRATPAAPRPPEAMESQPDKTEKYSRPVCRGCWMLGNNCGHCERCKDTKPKAPEVE